MKVVKNSGGGNKTERRYPTSSIGLDTKNVAVSPLGSKIVVEYGGVVRRKDTVKLQAA